MRSSRDISEVGRSTAKQLHARAVARVIGGRGEYRGAPAGLQLVLLHNIAELRWHFALEAFAHGHLDGQFVAATGVGPCCAEQAARDVLRERGFRYSEPPQERARQKPGECRGLRRCVTTMVSPGAADVLLDFLPDDTL